MRVSKAKSSTKKATSTGSSKSQQLEVSLDELKEILERAKGALSAEDFEKLDGAVDTLAALTQALDVKGTTIKRLRKMIFGSSTEKTRKVVGKKPKKEGDEKEVPTERGDTSEEAGDTSTSSSTSSDSPEDGSETGGERKKRKGHGRNGADSFTGAEKIDVSHETLKPGDRCPECE